MLKKMRWRMIGSAMLAFFAVIFLVGLLVNAVNYHTVTKRTDETLSHILEYEEHNENIRRTSQLPPDRFMELPDLEANYMTRFFTVRFDSQSNVISVSTDNIASIDETDAVNYAEKVLSSSDANGYLDDYRYITKKLDSETIVCFLNTIREQQFMRSLRNLTVFVAGASLLLVFILVYILSERAVRPFVHNIERQKQFITDASHELKTPLTSISTSIDVIAMEHGDSEWVENIRKQTGRMTKLVGDLVTLSRLNETQPLPVKETFSLSEAAWEIAEVYQPQAKAHGKEININIPDGLTMSGDRETIQKMLSVLLDNAIRYSSEHGKIGMTIIPENGRYIIKVQNTCRMETIPDVNRLFDRFYRPDSSRNENTGGTGIGLSIAKAAAQAHGGTISARCPDENTMIITAVIKA